MKISNTQDSLSVTQRQNLPPSTVIDGSTPSWSRYFLELYQYREVARVLVRRDLIIRFRQTFFGMAWLLFKPLMLMLVINLAFGLISRFETAASAPYPLVVLCGVIPWYFLSNTIPDGMYSIVSHLHIIQKTYFPRLIIPLVAVVTNAIEFLVAWLLFALACAWFGVLPGWQVVGFPYFSVLLLALGLGLSLWLSMLHARFRDVGNLVPFLVSIAFFVTPIGYTLSAVPAPWQNLLVINPAVGIVEGFRWSLLGGSHPFPVEAVVWSTVTSLGILMSGLWYFRRAEPAIVDVA